MLGSNTQINPNIITNPVSKPQMQQQSRTHSPENPPKTFPQACQATPIGSQKIFLFQWIGMFLFVYLQTCTKQPIGIHLQITLILLITIPMCLKISGAHYNPAVTVSNYMCRFSTKSDGFEGGWMYCKAQLCAAVVALGLGYLLNDSFMAKLALPSANVTAFMLMLSETISTLILVFYTQLCANSQTSILQNNGQKICFIIAFVFVARKTAYISSFAINPAITLATLFMDIVTCQYKYIHICTWYILGDFIGAVLGTYLYNQLYVPILEACRSEKQAIHNDYELEPLAEMDSNREEQSQAFSKNFVSFVEELELAQSGKSV